MSTCKNFKVQLQYDGSRYQGWQRQVSTDNTIQGKLEAVLSKMMEKPVEVQGAGRTDAGVHARGQVAHFQLETEKSAEQVMDYMNCYLPEDIAVVSCEEVPLRFHSRLNAKGKTYLYRVINSRIPHVLSRKYVYQVPEELDIEAMKRAAILLTGTHDFKAFTSLRKTKKSTVRTVDLILIEKTEDLVFGIPGQQDEIRFTFIGDGFLYHMVRIMTGTLLEVGMHKRRPEDIERIFASGRREEAGELVPAKGLTLMEVRY